MQNVTHWFLVGYILDCREWHLRILRVANLVDCKDFLSSHELSSLTYITPNESWNALCSLYAEGPLWARNVRKKALLTLWALWEKKLPSESQAFFLTWRVRSLSHEGAFFFSQKITDEQNTQRPTETLSQPISQNLTATFGSNALWILYAEGLLWVRNCAQKGSVKSVSSVREKKLYEVCKQPNRGNLTYYSPPYGGGAGGGATRFGGEAAVISIREGTVLLFIMLLFCRQTTPFMIRKRLLICRTTGYSLVL